MDPNNNAYVSKHFEANSHDPYGLLHAREHELCVKIFEKLWWDYPGYDWKVRVDLAGGMVSIKLPRIMHSTLGWNFPVSMLDTDPDMRIVTKAGGELLERFKLARRRVNKAEYTDLIRSKRVFTKYDHIDGGLAGNRTPERPRLIVPPQYANVSIDAIKGAALAQAARERAAAACRPVMPEDLDFVANVVAANDNTAKAVAA